MNPLIRLFLFCACLSLLPGVHAQSSHGQGTAATRTEAGNGYFAGGELTVNGPVQGDLFAAGGRVTVTQPVGADAAVAGGSVVVRTSVAQDLRTAGGNVDISGDIGGELVSAGGTVRIADNATVAGPALLTGGKVIIDGRLRKGARAYAGRITLGGEIDGDAHLYGREIVFRPGSRIDGDLFYGSPTPLPEDILAQVSGRVIREQTPEAWRKASSGGGWFHPVFFFSMLATGFVLYWLFPNAINGVRESIARAPLRSIVVGLALMFTLPPVALLLMLTIIGIPVGLGLLMLYPFMLMLGYLAAAFFIGGKLADAFRQPPPFSKRRQALFLAAALLVLVVAGAIPVLGWLFVFIALVGGIGGWAIWAVRRYRTAAA